MMLHNFVYDGYKMGILNAVADVVAESVGYDYDNNYVGASTKLADNLYNKWVAEHEFTRDIVPAVAARYEDLIFTEKTSFATETQEYYDLKDLCWVDENDVRHDFRIAEEGYGIIVFIRKAVKLFYDILTSRDTIDFDSIEKITGAVDIYKTLINDFAGQDIIDSVKCFNYVLADRNSERLADWAFTIIGLAYC